MFEVEEWQMGKGRGAGGVVDEAVADVVCDDDQGSNTDIEAMGIATPIHKPGPVLPLRSTRKSKSSSSNSPPQAELSDSSPNQRRRLSSKQTA